MDKIYLLRDFDKLQEETLNVLKGFYSENSTVIIKIHFGEPGNPFAFLPKDIKPIIDAMKDLKLSPIFIDTTVAYDSPRNNVKGYEEIVKERGYDKLAPFIISDNGREIKTKDFIAEVCKELMEAKNVLIISHVKGHALAGFGGAVKNLGMGGVTKSTKAKIHSLSKPRFVSECEGCGICAELCPANAIKMKDKKAQLNNDLCWGCSICQIECPSKSLAPEKAYFDDLLAQGASAVINNLPRNTFYINIIKNITQWCDCEINPGKLIAKDIGVLFSRNPVAIDKASIDLIRKNEGKEVFREINHKDPVLQLEYTSKYTNMGMDYEIETNK